MRWLALAVPFVWAAVTVPALADSPTTPSMRSSPTSGQFTMGELTPTPDMWFHQQSQRQYQDPKSGVRSAAEFRADQRLRRLASQKWFGMSNQRPRAGVDPVHSDYSAGWTSGEANYPNRFNGQRGPAVIIYQR